MAILIKYVRSDAWLLLSIIYASREHPATLGEILMMGDYINHIGFTQEELDGGFSRLKEGGWIGRSVENCSPSEKTLAAYRKTCRQGLSSFEELAKIESLLGIKHAP